MINLRGRGVFIRVFGSAIAMQGMLSAANFAAGLIIIRRTSNTDYGHYVLVFNAILLIVALQGSFFQPSIVTRLSQLDEIAARANFVGALLRRHWRLLATLTTIGTALLAVIYLTRAIDPYINVLLLVSVAAASATLFREFFRLILFAHRRPDEVLRADAVYVVLLICGVWAATYSKYPTTTAIAMLGVAAGIGGILQSRGLRRVEPWSQSGSTFHLREIVSIGAWATAGSALHWAFSQGYSYLSAATLSVAAVAAIASTRLLLMPLNLISTGIGTMMLPTVTAWLKQHRPGFVFRRLLLISLALMVIAVGYVSVIWLSRDWIFTTIMKKHFADRDALLLLWSAVFAVMLFRDQLLQLPMSCGRFRSLAGITLASTLIALGVCFVSLKTLGEPGAPLGVLIGELCNLGGIVYLSVLEMRRARAPAV